MEEVKASTTYIAVEIFNDGFAFERLATRPPEHEHLTPSDAALCLHENAAWGGTGILAIYGEPRDARPLTSEELEEIVQLWKSRSQQQASELGSQSKQGAAT
jgi:hypothetical protein